MRILITGATGFIGNNLMEYFESKKNIIFGISRSKTNKKIKNISLDDKTKLNNYFKKNKFDVVIHLGSTLNDDNPKTIFDENISSLITLLECCRINKIKKFIFASSHIVYGDTNYLPIDEIHHTNPKNNYGIMKLINENICKMYSMNYNLEISILRISSVYGKGQSEKLIIPTLVRNYLLSKELNIHKYKNGFQSMDLIHVDDVCQAIESTCKLKNKFDIFNVATGNSITAMEIAKIFLKIDKMSKIKIKKINQTTNHFFYDISKATKKLKFKPKIKVTEKMIKSWLDDSTISKKS